MSNENNHVEVRDENCNMAMLEVTVAVTNLTDLSAPRNLRVTQQESGQIKLFWNAPDSGQPPTEYTVQWKQSDADWEVQDDVSEAYVKETKHIITGLSEGEEYVFRVIASTDGTDSGSSKEATATPLETAPPTPSSATVDGATLTITFNEALDSGRTPNKSAFAVTVKGSSRGVDAVAMSSSVVTIALATAVFADDAVTADYTAPTDQAAPRLQDLAGNAAASFSGKNVSNNTQAADLLTGRRLGGARIPRWQLHLRTSVQRGGRPNLHDPAGPFLYRHRGYGSQGAATDSSKQHRLGDPRYAGRGRGRNHQAACHHGLQREGRHLHRGLQAFVQPAGCHRARATQPAGLAGELAGHRRADHQRHSPGGRDAHGIHLRHRRRGRLGRRIVQLPVGPERRER